MMKSGEQIQTLYYRDRSQDRSERTKKNNVARNKLESFLPPSNMQSTQFLFLFSSPVISRINFQASRGWKSFL